MLRRSSRNVNKPAENADKPVSATVKSNLSANTATATQVDEDVDMGYEDWEDDDDEDLEKSSEDEESDYGSSRKNANKAPPKKRAKTRQSIAASPSKNLRRKGSLYMLPSMPLDILFEIFSNLVPKDIVSLSRTSKIFYETLSGRHATSVWKAARERISAPDGPDWMSEAAWATMLFGHICQSCGTSNIQKIDFLLLKRICLSCKKEHYVLRSKVEKRYKTFDFVVLDLVPSTNISAWSTWARTSYYYWDQDLDFMVRKLADLETQVDAQQLSYFKGERKRRVQFIQQNVSSWRQWYGKMQDERSQDMRDAEEKRLLQVKQKFKELGYTEGDVSDIGSRKECRGKAQLTDQIWRRIRPILEPHVQEKKAERLEREMRTIKADRRETLASRYKEFKRTLHPSRWKYLPRSLEISAFEPFSRHIGAAAGVEIDESAFDDAFLELPSLLAATADQRKATLRTLMPCTPREDGEIVATDPLDLATAVFRCTESHNYFDQIQHVFGWDEVASHHCLPEVEGNHFYYRPARTTPVELEYSLEVANVVRKLAQLVGLDAATATAADFDEKNVRFSCDVCTWFKEGGHYYRLGYSWRNLAVHLGTPKSHNPNFHIKVLSVDEANEVRQYERGDVKWSAAQWTCSHCPAYLDKFQSRQIVVGHLSEKHGIEAPSEPKDLFFFERHRKDLSTKPRFLIPKPMNADMHVEIENAKNDPKVKFRCLVCPLNINRQFIFTGVRDHLRAKHNVLAGQGGVHYATVT